MGKNRKHCFNKCEHACSSCINPLTATLLQTVQTCFPVCMALYVCVWRVHVTPTTLMLKAYSRSKGRAAIRSTKSHEVT